MASSEHTEEHVDPKFAWGARFLGYGYGRLGRTADALEVVDRLDVMTRDGFASAANSAMVYLGMGDTARALDHLEAALEERPPGSTALAYVPVDPAWDPLKNEERFRRVVARVASV